MLCLSELGAREYVPCVHASLPLSWSSFSFLVAYPMACRGSAQRHTRSGTRCRKWFPASSCVILRRSAKTATPQTLEITAVNEDRRETASNFWFVPWRGGAFNICSSLPSPPLRSSSFHAQLSAEFRVNVWRRAAPRRGRRNWKGRSQQWRRGSGWTRGQGRCY